MKKILNIVLIILGSAFVTNCASKNTTVESDQSDVNVEVAESKPAPFDRKSKTVTSAPVQIPVQTGEIKNKTGPSLAAQLAMTEFKKGHFEIAETHMNKAIKAQPDKSELYHNLGLIHLAKGEQREALKAFRKGIQISPEDPALSGQMGAIFTKEKDYIKAEIALEIPVKNGTTDASILNNYAIVMTANKKFDEAEKIYEKALKANPSSRDIMLNYSMFLIEQKQKYKQALDLLSRLKFVGVQPEVRNIINVLENKAKAGLK